MSKKKGNKHGKVVQFLSPENYIRKNARKLEIHECWLNVEWEGTRMASIVVARVHKEGNITFGLYLVDLLCRGVKDTFYRFNLTKSEYHEMLMEMSEGMEMEKANYQLVHNIIYSSIEFAEEFDLKPHKDFEKTTEFILDEDDDKTELIEIECGHYGKPMVVVYPDNRAEANRLISRFEKTLGTGNYYFVEEDELDEFLMDDNEEDMDEELDDDEPFDLDDDEEFDLGISEYDEDDLDEKDRAIQMLSDFTKLHKLTKKFTHGKLSGKKIEEFIDHVSHMFYEYMVDLTEMIEVEQETDHLIDCTLSGDYFGEELIYGNRGSKTLSVGIEEKVNEFYHTDQEVLKKKIVLEGISKYQDLPVFYFLHLSTLIKDEDQSEYLKLLDIYLEKFPHYQPIRLFKAESYIKNDMDEMRRFIGHGLGIYDFYQGRSELSEVEVQTYVHFISNYFKAINNIIAFDYILDRFRDEITTPELDHELDSTFLKIKYMTEEFLIGETEGDEI
nr:hypothetical protein [Bacteroidota bacterium]